MKELKIGDKVEVLNYVANRWESRIFVKYGMNDGVICVNKKNEKYFYTGQDFVTVYWNKDEWRYISEKIFNDTKVEEKASTDNETAYSWVNYLSGIWDNPYVQQLGIIDHCREVVTIYDEWKAIKPQLKHSKDEGYDSLVTKTYKGLENEIMDLYLILERWAKDKAELKKKRFYKFIEKSENNN